MDLAARFVEQLIDWMLRRARTILLLPSVGTGLLSLASRRCWSIAPVGTLFEPDESAQPPWTSKMVGFGETFAWSVWRPDQATLPGVGVAEVGV
jgi:hypothetical protein